MSGSAGKKARTRTAVFVLKPPPPPPPPPLLLLLLLLVDLHRYTSLSGAARRGSVVAAQSPAMLLSREHTLPTLPFAVAYHTPPPALQNTRALPAHKKPVRGLLHPGAP